MSCYIKPTSFRIALVFATLLALAAAQTREASRNLVSNGGFEESANGQPTGWSTLWTRDANTAELALDAETLHAGKRALRVTHRGAQDWSLNSGKRLPVKTGDLFQLSAWLKVEGQGSAGTPCVTAWDANGKAVNWSLGARSLSGTNDWSFLSSRFVITPGIAAIEPRLIGSGPATVWADDFTLIAQGNALDNLPPQARKTITIANAALNVALDLTDLQNQTLTVTDKRSGRVWKQQYSAQQGILTAAAPTPEGGIRLKRFLSATGGEAELTLVLDGDLPELTATINAEPDSAGAAPFPPPLVSEGDTHLIVPMNEGISYPVDDPAIQPMTLVTYGGHGICMAFWGATGPQGGASMTLIETPDDAALRIDRAGGRLRAAPIWHTQKGRFAYERKLRYIFFDKGGHVAICKRYRRHVQQAGLLKTLAQKRAENPNVDLLIGAVNVWCWESNRLPIVREMQQAGIQRILWSHRGEPAQLKAMNDIPGVLTSRYDIYQDLMDPEVVKTQLRRTHADWTQAAWPDDLMLDERGAWRKGWRVKGNDGKMYPCGVLCDRQAVEYARRRIPAELKTHPYRSRFIDTTTASPWRECYHPDHPMTRGESRHWKMQLLRYMSEEMKLVTGCETGHEAAVPYVHYFEGMLSLGHYRVPDAGRAMLTEVTDVPEHVAKFQVGHQYRLPLWELVYHDCVVAQWYWGDYNNKLPALWDKRDLFNILYGTPPMFMFDRARWNKYQDRFVQSYQNVCPVVSAVGYAEMTDHRFLTPDRAVQQTAFANGATVTVNFGPTPHRLPDGAEIAPMSFHFIRWLTKT